MRRRRTFLLIAGPLVILLALFIISFSYYNTRVAAPKRIQQELLGRVIVDYADLTYYQADTAYGEGILIWIYRLNDGEAARLAADCREFDRGRCVVAEDVRREDTHRFIFAVGNRLRIEEWWN
jgi:hypothetical protein